MRISSISLHPLTIGLQSTFRHALSERSATQTVIVALGAGSGLFGYGEILPRAYLTGETIERVLNDTGPALAQQFLRPRFMEKNDVLLFLRTQLAGIGRDLACFAGFEVALLDLAGQAFGFPVGEVLGGKPSAELPAGVVIGFEIATRSLETYCAALRLSGRRHVKLKVGLPDDLQRASIVSGVFKPAGIRLDANGAWRSAEEAIRALTAMVDGQIPLASVEQPIAAEDLPGLRRIREETRIPVMVDESLCTLADAERLIDAGAADLFNIRLGKCGGFLASHRLVQRARRAGLSCHLGSLVGQTGILCRASEVFGRFVSAFDCLEGKGQNEFLLSEDLLDQPSEARTADLGAPGLGLRISPARLARLTSAEPIRFAQTILPALDAL